MSSRETLKEYGGYLPLELSAEREHIEQYGKPFLRTNSARAAIYFALKKIKPSKIYVPHYICTSVYDVINSLQIPITKYYINETFEPVGITPEPKDCILLVNYFGIYDGSINTLIEQFSETAIIADNTQAFFSPPASGNVYTVYSPRKFFGVSDGGYLANDNTVIEHPEESFSSENALHLLKPYEEGTNAAYSEFKKSESLLIDNYKGMSKLTHRILCSVDYESISEKRLKNFKAAREMLDKTNQIKIPDNASFNVPYMYPYLPASYRYIKEALIKKRFYCSTLWEQHLGREYDGTNEQILAKYCIPIPIDQRYSENDIKHLCEMVLTELNK